MTAHDKCKYSYQHQTESNQKSFQRKSLTASYFNRELEQLEIKNHISKDLETYEKIYLTSDWKSLAQSKQHKSKSDSEILKTQTQMKNQNHHFLELGRSNLEIFDSLNNQNQNSKTTPNSNKNQVEIKKQEYLEKTSNEFLDYLGKYKLVHFNPNLYSKEKEYDFYEYQRKLIHYKNLQYLESLLD